MLVTVAAQRLEQVQRPVDLGHMHHAPGADVATRRGPERGEVATEDVGARLDRDMNLRFVERYESALGTRMPERRLVVVQDMRTNARAAPGAAGVDAG